MKLQTEKEVYQHFLGKIGSGELKFGDEMPSRSEVAGMGVASPHYTAAKEHLSKDGLISYEYGQRGTVVYKGKITPKGQSKKIPNPYLPPEPKAIRITMILMDGELIPAQVKKVPIDDETYMMVVSPKE